jgi:hypothetical protein
MSADQGLRKVHRIYPSSPGQGRVIRRKVVLPGVKSTVALISTVLIALLYSSHMWKAARRLPSPYNHHHQSGLYNNRSWADCDERQIDILDVLSAVDAFCPE